ncbi:MAG TPA: substrate-binding domain-containing protein [Cyclobacteriaceae bacterium]|nr:substrate-binding domain-containing protein [Cyclobacteriaceae bacterium]
MKYISFLLVLILWACDDRDKKGQLLDTPTSGTIKIAVDESLKPLMQAEVEGFEGNYPDAHVKAEYTSEEAAIQALLKDSVRIAVVTRKLLPYERQKLDSVKIKGTEFVFAKEAIAVIVHKDNPDSLLRWDQLNDMLQGKSTSWDQLYPSSKLGDLQIVFDHPRSGIVRYLMDTLGLKSLPANCFAANTNEAVVNYVAKTKNAMGLIGLSWISDKDDPNANKFLATVKVVGIAREDEYLKPYKAYIALKKYPLSRSVVMISREARTGLGSGFITYAGSDKGQKIVLKAGLLPAKAPVRLVEISRKPLGKIVKE